MLTLNINQDISDLGKVTESENLSQFDLFRYFEKRLSR